jgi:hypothetical protein
MNNDKREAFENKFFDFFDKPQKTNSQKIYTIKHTMYVDFTAQKMWEAWQAALAVNEQKIAELSETLEIAQNGLIWYKENTDLANGCDDDALQQIEVTLKTIRSK